MLETFQLFKPGDLKISNHSHPSPHLVETMISKKCGRRIFKYSVITLILLVILIVYLTVIKPIQDGTSTANQFLSKMPDLKAAANITNGWFQPLTEAPVVAGNYSPQATKADIDALLASVQEYRDMLPGKVVKTLEDMAADHPTSRG